MHRIIYSLLFIASCYNLLSQNISSTELFGIVYSKADSGMLADVHVVNETSGLMTKTNSIGIFKMPVQLGDKLYFSCIGYEIRRLKINDSTLNNPIFIFLQPKIYELGEVRVRPYLSYDEFKKAFISMKVEPDTLMDLHLPKVVQLKNTEPGQLAPIVIEGPITALYMEFSKYGKSIKKYNETIANANRKRNIENHFNKEIVQEITGIETDKELVEFIDFCNLNDEFILKSSDYEIYRTIADCYKAYLLIN